MARRVSCEQRSRDVEFPGLDGCQHNDGLKVPMTVTFDEFAIRRVSSRIIICLFSGWPGHLCRRRLEVVGTTDMIAGDMDGRETTDGVIEAIDRIQTTVLRRDDESHRRIATIAAAGVVDHMPVVLDPHRHREVGWITATTRRRT